MSLPEIHHGSCLCGSIKITLEGAPSVCGACHCIDCQKSAGGPFQISAIYSTANVQVVDPENYLKSYAISGEALPSGFDKLKYFCGNCGTPLFNRSKKFSGDMTVIKTGVLDPPQGEGLSRSGAGVFKPAFEIFTKDRAAFVCPIADAKQISAGFTPQDNFK